MVCGVFCIDSAPSLIWAQGNDFPAFVLGALTAGGGITGYVRTGSVPSVTAGVTVGALVRITPSFQFLQSISSGHLHVSELY